MYRDMNVRAVAACMLVLLGEPAQALDACVLDVSGDEPILDIEVEQPGRLAWHPVTLPGYHGLLLRPLNRGGLYEIDGTNYREVPEPAPGSNSNEGAPVFVRGGWRMHLGEKGIIWGMPPSTDEWQQIAPGQRRWHGVYDEGTQDLYVSFAREGPVMRWTGTGFDPAEDLPVLRRDGSSALSTSSVPLAIRTVAGLGGTLAVTQSNGGPRGLWFRPEGGTWTLVADEVSLKLLQPELRLPAHLDDIDFGQDGRTIRLFASGNWEATLLLKRDGSTWKLVDAVPLEVFWRLHEPSGMRIGWIGRAVQQLEEKTFFRTRTIKPIPPVLHILSPGTVRPQSVEGIDAPHRFTGDPVPRSVFYFGSTASVDGIAPLFVRSSRGWLAYNGFTFTALPSLSLDRVGELSRISRIGPLVVVQSASGVFILDDDLNASRVDTFPVERPSSSSAEIAYLEESNLFVVVGNGIVYGSSDLTNFHEIPTKVSIRGIVAPLPDRSALLVVGADGLYTIEGSCPDINE